VSSSLGSTTAVTAGNAGTSTTGVTVKPTLGHAHGHHDHELPFSS
jgi:hypothetical protein